MIQYRGNKLRCSTSIQRLSQEKQFSCLIWSGVKCCSLQRISINREEDKKGEGKKKPFPLSSLIAVARKDIRRLSNTPDVICPV